MFPQDTQANQQKHNLFIRLREKRREIEIEKRREREGGEKGRERDRVAY